MWTPCWAIHKLVSQGSPANVCHVFLFQRMTTIGYLVCMAMVYMWVKIYEEVKGRRKRVKVVCWIASGEWDSEKNSFCSKGWIFPGNSQSRLKR